MANSCLNLVQDDVHQKIVTELDSPPLDLLRRVAGAIIFPLHSGLNEFDFLFEREKIEKPDIGRKGTVTAALDRNGGDCLP